MRVVELLRNYDMIVIYHLNKVNVVANSLHQMSMYIVDHFENEIKELVFQVHRLARLALN